MGGCYTAIVAEANLSIFIDTTVLGLKASLDELEASKTSHASFHLLKKGITAISAIEQGIFCLNHCPIRKRRSTRMAPSIRNDGTATVSVTYNFLRTLTTA